MDDYYNVTGYMMPSIWLHAAGIDDVLFEGNDGNAFAGDVIHGTHQFVTMFRNVWLGWETGKSNQTTPFILKSFSRYMNAVGNVLEGRGITRNTSPTARTATHRSLIRRTD